MIKVQNLTPEIYYKQSRDFQFIGRLYDIVFNSLKTNADMLYNLPLNEDTPDSLSDLIAHTMGIRLRHNYTSKQLRIFCNIFPLALKNKGNIKSIMYVANALINAEGCKQELDYSLENNNKTLRLYLPQELKDTTMLNELLDYLLPAGMSCEFIKQLIFTNDNAATELKSTDTVTKLTNGDIENYNYLYDENNLAVLPEITNSLSGEDAKDTVGILANSNIYKPKDN